jgi:alpha-mannosidase
LFELSGAAVLSVVKESESGEFLVVRLFNPYRDRDVSASLKWGKAPEKAYEAKLNEAVQGVLPVVGDVIYITDIKPCQVKTVLVRLK